MRKTQLVLGSLLAGTLMLAPGQAVRADDSVDDRLEERVEKSLGRNKALSHLDVDVKDGVATLTGEVGSAAEKARAERLAKAAGAKTVVNQLEIDADKAIAAAKERGEAKKDRIEDRAAAAKEAVDRQTDATTARLEKAEDTGKTAVRTGDGTAVRTGDGTTVVAKPKDSKEVIDPLVTAKVKTKIVGDDLLDKSDINVDSEADGLVTLRGTVPSAAAHARALELARTTEGVRKVVDRLTVKAPVTK
ncbi:MAG TPA: BON domain-containing protein [Polyangia bacterium]